MKAYKGFDHNMQCRGFQFEEGKTYAEDEAKLCDAGFHVCENPLDVWNYYSPADGCEYHEVELEEVSDQRNSDDSKVCGKRIRIGAKLGIKGIVNAFVNLCIEKTKREDSVQDALTDNGGDGAQIGSSGYWARIVSSGNRAHIGSSGGWAQIGSTGYWAQIGASGYGARIGSSGDWAYIGSTGHWTHIGSSGDRAQIGSSGDWTYIGSTGDGTRIGSSGHGAHIETRGTNCVMMCAGQSCRAKGKIGSWIVLTEWIDEVPNVVAKRIDGAAIKADTWYVLRDGQLQEAATDE